MSYIISNGKTYGGNVNLVTKGVDFVEITYEEYLKIEDRETNGVLYCITDLDQYIKAENVAYGDSNVKDTLDGLNSNLIEISSNIITDFYTLSDTQQTYIALHYKGKPIDPTTNPGYFFYVIKGSTNDDDALCGIIRCVTYEGEIQSTFIPIKENDKINFLISSSSNRPAIYCQEAESVNVFITKFNEGRVI